jgi:4,5-dihydroxyphthalate decarboxylase
VVALKLTLACVPNYDRTGPFLSGDANPEGIEFSPSTFRKPGDLFRRIAQDGAFDVSEMSVSTFTAMLARGDTRYVGLPVFPRRAFRHAFLWINTNSGITVAEDLKGRRVGVSEYQQTASMWIRAFLADDYGVTSDKVTWVTGGMDEDEPERYAIELDERIRIERVPEGRALSEMLEKGDIDCMIGARVPDAYKRGVPHVKRLFENYFELEQDYYRRTGWFPIMHMLVLRRSIYEANPWTGRAIVDAFETVRSEGWKRLTDLSSYACQLPWLLPYIEQTRSFFGDDPFPYGIQPNARTLEYMYEQSFVQGLSSPRLQLADMFPAEFLDAA